MKLTDIKKLKVAELRSRLKKLDLDSKGLKAELVERLWSFLAAEQKSKDEEEPSLQHETSETHLTTTETLHVHTSASPPRTQTEIIEPERVKVYSDSATQTETNSGLTTPQHRSEIISGSQTGGDHPEEEEQGGQSSSSSSSQDRGRGRAFYEFKEEIRYKR